MGNDFIQNIDPLCCRVGPFGFRYYTLLFFFSLVIGYFLWSWQVRRSGRDNATARSFIPWGVAALFIGARLGHCLFYEPAYFVRHPLEILAFWRGGLSSHGAAAAMAAALVMFARHKGIPALEVVDRFTFSAAAGAALVRLGNFFNSEIVGRATEAPWGVRFIRFDGGAELRHPSQLYEFVVGLAILAALVVADRMGGREKRIQGLLTGVFLTGYFTLRFVCEFFKEYQTLPEYSPLTMGQYLSIPLVVIGIVVLIRAVKKERRLSGTGAGLV
jgi:phosphatidylglycerol:prolipoprotein diacylglycerol transferase